MQIHVLLDGFSAHKSNPNAINVQFGAEDGTSATIAMGMGALAGLSLGAAYVIDISPADAGKDAPTQTATTPAQPPIDVEGHAVADEVTRA